MRRPTRYWPYQSGLPHCAVQGQYFGHDPKKKKHFKVERRGTGTSPKTLKALMGLKVWVRGKGIGSLRVAGVRYVSSGEDDWIPNKP